MLRVGDKFPYVDGVECEILRINAPYGMLIRKPCGKMHVINIRPFHQQDWFNVESMTWIRPSQPEIISNEPVQLRMFLP